MYVLRTMYASDMFINIEAAVITESEQNEFKFIFKGKFSWKILMLHESYINESTHCERV